MNMLYWMDRGGNKEVCNQQSSNKNSMRGNIHGHYSSYATNGLRKLYQRNNRKLMKPNS